MSGVAGSGSGRTAPGAAWTGSSGAFAPDSQPRRWIRALNAPRLRCRAPPAERKAGNIGSSGSIRVHVVVVGCGRVGSELAGALELGGHTVSVVDKRKEAFRRLPPSFGGKTIVGFGFDRDTLLEAQVDQAGAFAAVTSGDNSNIMAARVGRETFEIERVVARIYDPRRAAIYQRLGIPTVATVAWTTDQVLRRLLPGDHARELDRLDRRGRARRARPAAGVGRTAARASSRNPAGASSCRSPGSARPGSSTPSSSARRATSSTSSSRPARSASCRSASTRARDRRTSLMRVAIAGAGNVGWFIASELVDERPRRAAAREGSRGRGAARQGAGHRAAGRRRVRGQLAARRRRSTRCDVDGRRDRRRRGQPRRSRCCRSRSSRCRASSRA